MFWVKCAAAHIMKNSASSVNGKKRLRDVRQLEHCRGSKYHLVKVS